MNIELQHIFTGHADAVYSLCHGHESPFFYSGSADQFVGCWNNITGTFEKPLVKSTGSIYALLHDKENQLLYVGQRRGTVIIVDLTRQNEPKSVQAHDGDIFSIVQDYAGKIYTAGGDGYLKIWDALDFHLIHSSRLSTTNVRCIHFTSENNELIVGLSDHTIRIFDAQTLELKQILTGHKNSVFTIESLNSKKLVSAGRDAVFIVWEKVSDKWEKSEVIQAHLYTVNHLALSPDKKLLASASRDKTFKIWNADSLQLLKVIDINKFPNMHTHSVNRLLWIDDEQLLSTGDDKKIISWKLAR